LLSNSRIQIFTLLDIPQVSPGDNLTFIIEMGLKATNEKLEAGDVVVIAQKIVSKAQNRYVDLKSVNGNIRTLHAVYQKHTHSATADVLPSSA